MGTFHKAANGLLEFLSAQGPLPEYKNIWVVEDCYIKYQNRPSQPPVMTFPRSAIHDIKDYENRFDEILKSGVPWVNVSCYGFLPGVMLIGIELPNSNNYNPPNKVAINYSGPPMSIDSRPRWDVFDRVIITD